MNNVAVRNLSNNSVGQELVTFIENNGKYGCYALAIIAVWSLAYKALDNKMPMSVVIDKKNETVTFKVSGNQSDQ